MSKMYQGYELISVKSAKNWQVQIVSGGKLISTTMLFADEETALAEAKKAVEGYWGLRRSGPAQKPPPTSDFNNSGET
jgi:hypothetical protein